MNADADGSVNAKMPMSRFPNGLLLIYRDHLLCQTFKWLLLKFKGKDLCLHEVFTIFNVVKILAKCGTTWKMLKANLWYSCVGFLFWVFKDCLRIYVMFVNVNMCGIVLITSESTHHEFCVAQGKLCLRSKHKKYSEDFRENCWVRTVWFC